ncbi:MAG TPA: hypothetical protein VMB79_16920, partial [Jatrophihabitans sp.]|nr:hypothetical protein [Jatrophihabitans sp.]
MNELVATGVHVPAAAAVQDFVDRTLAGGGWSAGQRAGRQLLDLAPTGEHLLVLAGSPAAPLVLGARHDGERAGRLAGCPATEVVAALGRAGSLPTCSGGRLSWQGASPAGPVRAMPTESSNEVARLRAGGRPAVLKVLREAG